MSNTEDRPLVDDEVHGSITNYLQRILERATPDSLVAGGGTDELPFQRRPRNHQQLKKREEIYLSGGLITDFIDSRALMTFGTGTTFETEEEAITDDQGRTVDEWLHDEFGDTLDVFLIDSAAQAYWAGDAWPEIVETRGGDFSHVDLVDPTTVDPTWDEHGEIQRLDQVIVKNGQANRQPLDQDRIGHFTFKDSPGGPLGVSLVDQNMDSIEMFIRNREQRANAIQLHGSPKYDVSVGSEGQSIPDRIMRRIRNQFRADNVDEKTTWTHGGDISIETLDSPGFEGMGDIIETDIRMLAGGFGIPLEYTNFGSAGLGEGAPAEARERKFERQARADQKRRASQFVDQVVRYVLEHYSPFPRDIDVDLVFGDVVSDQASTAEWMKDYKSYLTTEEIRDRLDLPMVEDESELGPPEGAIEEQDAAGDPGGIGGGFFSDGRANERALFHSDVSADDLTQEELVWGEVYDRVLWSDESERALFEFDPEEVPEFVVERLQEAIDSSLFDQFDTIPSQSVGALRDTLLDSLETQHGWSIASLRDNLLDEVPGLDDAGDAERIARTETQALVNTAREEGYEEQFDLSEERFRWNGPDDHRTTESCEWIKSQIPDEGVTMSELKVLISEANDRFVDHDGREYTPHISCRHTFTRVV